MKPSEVLRKAAEKIATPEKWTTGAFGRKADGSVCSGGDPGAVAFCLSGALIAASGVDPVYLDASRHLSRALIVCGATGWVETSATGFNDSNGRTHAEVLAALTKAAELAESEGQ
jgi:hypothetical protein